MSNTMSHAPLPRPLAARQPSAPPPPPPPAVSPYALLPLPPTEPPALMAALRPSAELALRVEVEMAFETAACWDKAGVTGVVDDQDLRRWWAALPDVFKPDYPFDIPPAWLPYATWILSQAEVHRHCARRECRRAQGCLGGEGPPCLRADRAAVQQVLLVGHLAVMQGLSGEEYDAIMTRIGNRYAPATEPATATAKPKRSRARR